MNDWYRRYLHNLHAAIEAVFIHKFRSILTALGIIFGVAAVIAMMAVGNGARQEILDQIKMVGVNNIVITPVITEQKNDSQQNEQETPQNNQKKFSPGLTLNDAQSIRATIPGILYVSPEIVYNVTAVRSGIRASAKLSGIEPAFFKVYSLELLEGKMFTPQQLESGAAVCIIGPEIRSRFFKQENPIGKTIRCGDLWLEVIGITRPRMVTKSAMENFAVSEFNNTVFAPVKTVLLRYRDRSLITRTIINRSKNEPHTGNINQLDKIIVQLADSEKLSATAGIIRKMLLRLHNNQEDFTIIIPELLLKQQQRTRDIFNIVLGAIAGISLIVGGIGIMNIMLASVMERMGEIGIRKAMGARKSDIVFQFLTEAVLISISGGIIGVITGIVLAELITRVTGILTIVSVFSVLISFGVAATVGIIFGWMPARKAAAQDPVITLRHE